MVALVGIDLGGTKIELIALDQDARELLRHRVSTPRGDYEATVETLVRLVRGAEAELGTVDSVGVGTPGAVSPASGLMKNCNSVWLNDRALKRDLEARLGREVRLANDANCFALSEATDGAGAGAEIVFGVIVGTGTGGGIVVNRRLLVGVNAIAGEWGHNPLPWSDEQEWPGPRCYCGRRGCIETFLSGPALAREYARESGKRLNAEQIVRAAEHGDATAEAVLVRYEDRMARALAQVINVVDPEVIVLGGGLSNIARLYVNVPMAWDAYVFSDRVDTVLRPPRHGDSSGVRGAAWLWRDTPGDGARR